MGLQLISRQAIDSTVFHTGELLGGGRPMHKAIRHGEKVMLYFEPERPPVGKITATHQSVFQVVELAADLSVADYFVPLRIFFLFKALLYTVSVLRPGLSLNKIFYVL